MAGNTIEYMGEEAVRSWNDKTKAINSDIRENLQGVRDYLQVIMDNSEGEVADLLAQYAHNIGEASSDLFDGMSNLDKAVDDWSKRAQQFSAQATAAIKAASNAL